MFNHNKGSKTQKQPKKCIRKDDINNLIDKSFTNFSQVSDLTGLNNSIEFLLYLRNSLAQILIQNSQEKNKINDLTQFDLKYYKKLIQIIDTITKEKTHIHESQIPQYINQKNTLFVTTRKEYK